MTIKVLLVFVGVGLLIGAFFVWKINQEDKALDAWGSKITVDPWRDRVMSAQDRAMAGLYLRRHNAADVLVTSGYFSREEDGRIRMIATGRVGALVVEFDILLPKKGGS